MTISQIRTVYLKEMRDIARDRRSLFSGLIYALLGPFIVVLILTSLSKQNDQQPLIEANLSQRSAAPELANYLESHGVVLSEFADIELLVNINERNQSPTGKKLNLTIRADQVQYQKELLALNTLLKSYESQLVKTALVGRGIASQITNPMTVEHQYTSKISIRGKVVISLLLIFFICTPFISTMAAATDLSAGERERGTLEPLLIRPIHPVALAMGKWLALVTLGLISVLLVITIGLKVLDYAPTGNLGVTISYDQTTILLMVLALLPLVLSISALQLVLGLSAKTYKEGQNYLNLVSMIPVMTGMIAVYTKLPYTPYIPILGDIKNIETILIGNQALMFQSLPIIHLSLCAIFLYMVVIRFKKGGGILGTGP